MVMNSECMHNIGYCESDNIRRGNMDGLRSKRLKANHIEPDDSYDHERRSGPLDSVYWEAKIKSATDSNRISSSSLTTHHPEQADSPRDGAATGDDTGDRKTCPSSRERKQHALKTLRWLEENYCASAGVCLPRCILYSHYLEFCHDEKVPPACAATLGKVIRQKFPHLSTRRLGTRGHSKYHYYGIAIRETSSYYQALHYGKELTRFSGSKFKSEGGFSRTYSLVTKSGMVLPEFPKPESLILPDLVGRDKVRTLLMMYRAHCQTILDAIIASSFTEIRNHLVHFWLDLPAHLLPLLDYDVILDVICVADSILHKASLDVLIPATMQEMPKSLLGEIRHVAKQWDAWVSSSLDSAPQRVRDKRLPIARRFAQALKRHASFLHLAQAVRPVFYDVALVNQMIEDVEQLDLAHVKSLSASEAKQQNEIPPKKELLTQFKELLRQEATVEAFTDWLDTVVEHHVIKPSSSTGESLRTLAQQFLLRWSFFGARILHNLTVNNAKSFASVHVIRMLMDEYILLAVETQIHNEAELCLYAELEAHTKPDKIVPRHESPAPSSCLLASRSSEQGQSVIRHLTLGVDERNSTSSGDMMMTQMVPSHHGSDLRAPSVSSGMMGSAEPTLIGRLPCQQVKRHNAIQSSCSYVEHQPEELNHTRATRGSEHLWTGPSHTSISHRSHQSQTGNLGNVETYQLYTGHPGQGFSQQWGNSYPPFSYYEVGHDSACPKQNYPSSMSGFGGHHYGSGTVTVDSDQVNPPMRAELISCRQDPTYVPMLPGYTPSSQGALTGSHESPQYPSSGWPQHAIASPRDPCMLHHDYTMTGNISGQVTVTYNGVMTSSVTMTTPDPGPHIPAYPDVFQPPTRDGFLCD